MERTSSLGIPRRFSLIFANISGIIAASWMSKERIKKQRAIAINPDNSNAQKTKKEEEKHVGTIQKLKNFNALEK